MMYKAIYERSSKPLPTPENDKDFSFSMLGVRAFNIIINNNAT